MDQSVSREILWNVPQVSIVGLYISSALIMFLTFLWVLNRLRIHQSGSSLNKKPKSRKDSSHQFLDYIFSHRMIRKDPYAGWMHLCLFWGFMILILATTLVGLQHHLGIKFLYGWVFIIFSLTADFGGLVFCIGLCMAINRRFGRRQTSRLQKDPMTNLVLFLLLLITVTGFLLEGSRISRNFHTFELASPIGYLCGLLLSGLSLAGENTPGVHRFLWNFHGILVLTFFGILPYSIMKHILLASVQVFKSSFRAGQLSPASGPVLSGLSLAQFSQTDLLQADACLTCGRCNDVCPAREAGKPLNPRSIVSDLRHHMNQDQTPLENPETYDALWSCTTCHACDAACPVHINIMDKIVNFRRGFVSKDMIPDRAAQAMSSGQHYQNPFGQPNSTRTDWSSGLNVPVVKETENAELLYWIGCSGAFDPEGKEVSRSMVKILNHLKISYKTLGCKEKCTGDPFRRMGEEGLWKKLSKANTSLIKAHKVKTILTHCPHCFNSFKNEYDFGETPPRVIHHSEWLKEQIASGRLKSLNNLKETVTWHDPCYLSRSNHILEDPRNVIDSVLAVESRVELKKSGADSSCCGGGGGQIWIDSKGSRRVESVRASHIEESKATTAVTGCPFCKTMLKAGKDQLGQGEGNWQVKDLAQLVAEQLP